MYGMLFSSDVGDALPQLFYNFVMLMLTVAAVIKRIDDVRLPTLVIFIVIFLIFSARNIAFQLRSEEHTSELQSLMRISYAIFCLKKKKKPTTQITQHNL